MSNNKAASPSIEKLSASNDTVVPEASDDFVSTPYVQELTARSLAYLRSGYAVHFSGPAGTGKTTLAFHVAALMERPVSLIHGDEDFSSADLIGRDMGFRKHRVVDNYIRSVHKMEEETKALWMDNRLTTACMHGHTLIYDEFNRSKPEANTPLLSILSERILNLPKLRRTGEGYINVNSDFHAIFTSNPEEYAGVHKTQDALIDRMITIRLEHFDRDTEVEITVARSGIERSDAETIVDIVRELRSIGVNNNRPTIRACIAIGRILANEGSRARVGDRYFEWACEDVLNSETAKVTRDGRSQMPRFIKQAVAKHAAVTN